MTKYKLALFFKANLDNYLMCPNFLDTLSSIFKGDANGQNLIIDGASDA